MGVIVEQTLEHAHANEEKMQKLKEAQQARELALLREIFIAADADGGGTVSKSEFLNICGRKDVQEMFKILELPVNRPRLATRLFEVLDSNGSLPTIGGSRDRGVWHTNFGINYGSISFGQLSGYIVFCTVPIWGAKPPL